MKKFTVLLFTVLGLFLFSPNLFAQGEQCSSAVVINVGPHVSPGPFWGNAASNICYSGATHAYWYSYTATADGDVRVTSTDDPNLTNTRVSIYTGTCFGGLTCYAQDDDSGDGNTSDLTFSVDVGVSYFIEWDDRWTTNGFEWELSFADPVQTCEEAIEQVMNDPSITAPLAAGEHWWYYFTTAEDMVDVVISVCGSTFDTKLAVFQDCGDFVDWSASPPAGVFAYNDDNSTACGSGNFNSQIDDGTTQAAGTTLPATLDAGTYYVAVYGYNSSSNGDYTLEITGNPVPEYGTLNGTVSDSVTGSPIEGAEIEITPATKATLFTDEFGFYEDTLEVGTYDVAISKTGYQPQMVSAVSVTPGDTTTVDFLLVPLDPFALPFYEAWDEASYAFNSWSAQGNWVITTSTSYGNPVPAARFNWAPTTLNYSQLLQSYLLDGTSKADVVYVSFDLYLNNYSTSTLEELDFVVFDGTDWQVVDHWDNQGGSFAWTTLSYDISAYAAGNVFRIGFLAYGETTYNVNGWAVDNISVSAETPVGDIAGTVSNLNNAEPVEGAMVTVSSVSKDPVTVYTNEFGEYLVEGIDFGLYDVSVSDDEYSPVLIEDVEVVGGVTSTVDVELDPIAPELITAQYGDGQVTLEWEKIPEGSPMDNIAGTSLVINNDMYEPGQTLDFANYEFNIYRSVGGSDFNGFEYLTTVMDFYYVDPGLNNGTEYCYYVTQILEGEKEGEESLGSNILCATPNEPPTIAVDPTSFYEVMNPDMILTRTMTITNTTGGPLDLDFEIVVGSKLPENFLSVEPATGIAAPGDSIDVEVEFNSEDLGVGYYPDTIVIYSNDLNNPLVIVPVAIEIFQPLLEVEAGYYSNELTITPIPDEPGDGQKSIDGSYLEAVQTTYTPGETTTWDLVLYNGSTNAEWLTDVYIVFPTGVTVTGAINFNLATPDTTRYLLYDGTTGDGVELWWGDPDAGYGEIYGDEFAYATVDVSIDPGFSGPIDLFYEIYGDEWGGEPHIVFGTYTLNPNILFVQSFNIYRNGELIEAEWPETTYVDEPLDSNVEYCYTVTQNYDSIPPSAHSIEACATPYGDGDRCEVAFEYTVVGDTTVFGSTTYGGDFVWYSVENPETQDFYVSLCGSGFDTKVAVYKSCDDFNGTFPDWYDYAGAIAFNDDSYACDGGNYSLQSLTHVNWAAPETYYVLIWGWGGDYGNYELKIHGDQSKLTRVGWGSLSTYVDLDNKGTSIEDVFADVDQQLTILIQDMGIYWPGYNLNTIGDYDTYSGCKAKWNDETTWIVEGDIVDDVSVTFPAGTYYLPVLNITPVGAQGFITVAAVEFMFDIDNGLIYWPEGGIVPGVDGSIEYLFPGSAYIFRCTDEVTFDFEPYAPTDYIVSIPQDYFRTFENNTTWNDVLKTGDHHIVGFSRLALDVLEPDDYIGVFNAEGICTGMQLYAGKESALAMPVNGNDITTQEVDGMTDQEFLNFRIYRDGRVCDVNPVYNPAMPNYDGLFNVNGLSQVTDFKFDPLSIEENPISSVMIYPNPSSGVFNIHLEGFENTLKMEVLNSRGQLIHKTGLNASHQLDLTGQPKGVYFIRLFNSTSVYLKKVVIK